MKRFETTLLGVVTRFGGADARSDDVGGIDDLIVQALRDPARRLLATPDGPVLYENPLLDSAWALTSEFGAAADGDDLDNNVWHWRSFLLPFVRGRLSRSWDVLKDRTPVRDVQIAKPGVRLAVFGDGGYAGLAQRTIFRMMASSHGAHRFDAVVHLGDTYHGGTDSEMFRHLVVPFAELRNHITLDRMIFSLCGNHDIYAGPDGYAGALSALDQPGRYFAIEADSWRIACLDSALPATDLLRSHGQLDEEQLRWLKHKQRTDPKDLVVLTHHMPRSAWEDPSEALLAQVTSIPGLFAWYWGHEHRAAAFAPRRRAAFIGGCVGNGVFLEKYSEPPEATGDPPAWFARGRCTCFSKKGPHYWPHGFLELELGVDELRETWHVEGTAPYTRSFRRRSGGKKGRVS